MNTEVLSIHNSTLFEHALEKAVALLNLGHVVALPTETVYGLAADALNPTAIQTIYDTKRRPATNPLIVHIASRQMLNDCVGDWPERAEKFARSFWPGPLTLVLPKAACITNGITAGLDSVALRWPGHPFMQAAIRRLGRPVAAPSANLANQLSPTSAEHVLTQLNGRIPLIVDGGASNVGIESTVLDLCGKTPTVLRPGMIHLESLQAVDPETKNQVPLKENELKGSQEPQLSPGLHRKHYAPQARMKLLSWETSSNLESKVAALGAKLEKTCIICHDRIPSPDGFARVSVIPHDPEAYARALYGELFIADREEPDLILVESVPNTPSWHGVQDRLTRASTD
ncbi:MAG: threonylcarbamoyl-AMP synthase [Verrucomicrobia bacterium]|nr:threonylcarbamoyl-AMP synthase [Verrucomicrobiota bacterium]